MWLKYIIISFFLSGISDTTWKMAGEVAPSSVNSYLFIFHIFALLSAMVAFFITKRRIKKDELFLGMVIGFSLIAGGIFSLKAIILLPGIVFFPISSCASLLLVTMFASMIWKEKPTIRQAIGLIIACISIILIAI
ncbi:MAG: EamA family transporter [bacterium]|nr:EamA family transporter [bacterium]